MRRVSFVEVVGGVDVQLALTVAAQRNADGIYPEIVMDLFGDFAHQFVHIETRQHGIGDGDQNAEIIALAAQQVVIHVIGDAALDLLCHDGHNLREGMQPLVLRLGPGLVVITDKLAAAKNLPFHRQRQHAVVAERVVKVALCQLRPSLAKLVKIAVQRFRAGENTSHRTVGQKRFIFIFEDFAVITR